MPLPHGTFRAWRSNKKLIIRVDAFSAQRDESIYYPFLHYLRIRRGEEIEERVVFVHLSLDSPLVADFNIYVKKKKKKNYKF